MGTAMNNENEYTDAAKVPPMKVTGILTFMEFHRRIFKGAFGRLPSSIKVDAFAMSGYCLDAPDCMPAGGCYAFPIDVDGDGSLIEFVPTQMEVSR
jgi:hypothetical protein